MADQTLISNTVSLKASPWHRRGTPAVAAGKRAAERVCKWATPLWTSVKAGSGLTVNCMCRMGRSRRHNYTNPLLISGSVGKLTRNDARDVASTRIPNKKTLQRALETRDGVAPHEWAADVRSDLIGGDSHLPCEPRCTTCPLDCGWSSRPLAASGQYY